MEKKLLYSQSSQSTVNDIADRTVKILHPQRQPS